MRTIETIIIQDFLGTREKFIKLARMLLSEHKDLEDTEIISII